MNEQMGKLSIGSKDIKMMKYFSTHPPTKERIQNLHQHLNEAMDIYQSHCHQIQKDFKRIS
jgi:predicted Zn-dependent protease